jgi:hypothetical protein
MKREGDDLDESKTAMTQNEKSSETKDPNVRKKKRVKFGKLHLEVSVADFMEKLICLDAPQCGHVRKELHAQEEHLLHWLFAGH